ncbi:MAG: ferrous iron transport protein A [Tissierellia bacterium]|nr:ferrous iron transport protein A [Tissierellia bacterium]
MSKINLSNLHPGDKGVVRKITAGSYATKRLYEMGFNTGANLMVVKNDRGPIIVSLSGNKIALGRGLAEKVIVENN